MPLTYDLNFDSNEYESFPWPDYEKRLREKQERLSTHWTKLVTPEQLKDIQQSRFIINHVWDKKVSLSSEWKKHKIISDLVDLLEEREHNILYPK